MPERFVIPQKIQENPGKEKGDHEAAFFYASGVKTGLLLLFFFLFEEHAAAFGVDILAEASACSRVGAVDGEALTLLALLAGLSLLLVHDIHGRKSIYL